MCKYVNEHGIMNKSNLYKIFLPGLIFILSGFVISDNNWEVVSADEMTKKIKEIESFYKTTKAYSIVVSHKSYKNYTSNIPEDQSNGFFIKDTKNNYHSYSMGIRTVQNDKVRITIDSLNKSILINQPDKSFSREVKISELKDLLKTCSKMKIGTWSNIDKLRFEFSRSSSYSAYEIWTSTSYRITRVVIYFNIEIPTDPDDEKSPKTKPRAEIVFSDYKTGISPDYKKYFDETKYIVFKNGEYAATDKYADFLIYDLRVKN